MHSLCYLVWSIGSQHVFSKNRYPLRKFSEGMWNWAYDWLPYFTPQYSMHGHILKLAEAEKAGIEAAGGKADLYQ